MSATLSKESSNFEFEKDPFTLKSTKYLIELFPNARFILMTRDGRATAHSIISRQVTISGFDITSYRDVITKVCFRDPRVRCEFVRDFLFFAVPDFYFFGSGLVSFGMVCF